MELYTAGTGNGQRAAIAVNECGVSCKIHVLDLAQGDQKKPDYLKINPTARIPTLIDPDGPGPIWEVPVVNLNNLDCTHYPEPQSGVPFIASAGEC